MSFLILFAIVVACFFFGKGFFEKVGLFVTLFASALILQSCYDKHHDASLVKQVKQSLSK